MGRKRREIKVKRSAKIEKGGGELKKQEQKTKKQIVQGKRGKIAKKSVQQMKKKNVVNGQKIEKGVNTTKKMYRGKRKCRKIVGKRVKN